MSITIDCNYISFTTGVPSVPASIQLELTVLYNTLLFALSLSEFTETGVLLIQGIARGRKNLRTFNCSNFTPVFLRYSNLTK